MSERWWRDAASDYWRGYSVNSEDAKTIRTLREEWKEIKVIDEYATIYQTPSGIYLVAEDGFGLIRMVRLERVGDYVLYQSL